MTKLICVSSNISFTVGKTYKPDGHRITSETGSSYFLNGGNGLVVSGTYGEAYATFKVKEKSLLKMLVRAYKSHAISRGWGDSANGPYMSWSGTPFNSAGEWARHMALGTCTDSLESSAVVNNEPLDQDYVNQYVEDEMSYW
ncbi:MULTISPECIES: hypothetical protein [Gammaproteobacteria]|uniref:hypothetical protein n=1 Tax=Gammaproteobacteria TaxID=1236 RepID=UPI002FCAE1A2